MSEHKQPPPGYEVYRQSKDYLYGWTWKRHDYDPADLRYQSGSDRKGLGFQSRRSATEDAWEHYEGRAYKPPIGMGDEGEGGFGAYMNQERKATIHAELKKIIPKDWKWSLSVRHHSTIVLTIAAAPIDLLAGESQYRREQVDRDRAQGIAPRPRDTHRTISDPEQYFSGALLELFKRIKAAMNVGNHDNSDSMTDYFDVGWYTEINIGSWDKPFRVLPGGGSREHKLLAPEAIEGSAWSQLPEHQRSEHVGWEISGDFWCPNCPKVIKGTPWDNKETGQRGYTRPYEEVTAHLQQHIAEGCFRGYEGGGSSCEHCGKPLNPVEVMVSSGQPICGACGKEKHRAFVEGRQPRFKKHKGGDYGSAGGLGAGEIVEEGETCVRRIKRIPSHSGHARFLATVSDPTEVIPRISAIRTPYSSGPTHAVYRSLADGRPLIILETAHKRYDVFEILSGPIRPAGEFDNYGEGGSADEEPEPITVESLLEAFGTPSRHRDALTESGARKIVAAIDRAGGRHKAVEDAMELANEILGGHGVEALHEESAQVDKYWYDVIALYVNFGDTYDVTLLYDTAGNFLITSYGDFLEEWEQNEQAAKELDESDDDDDSDDEEPDDEPSEPEEGDITTKDHRHFYQEGELILTLRDDDDMWAVLEEWMAKHNFYPNVWLVSDHGNAHLIRRR